MDDDVALMIDNMERLSHSGKYEEAQYVLNKIKEELGKPSSSDKASFEDLKMLLEGRNRQITIKETYAELLGHSIRINPDYYPFHLLLKLTVDVHRRIKVMKNPWLCSNVDNIRKIVAEEMVKNNMTIPVTYRGIKPNRAFLDIALKVNPSLCKGELERREKVKLWKAVKTGDKVKIEKAKKEYSRVRNCGVYD